MNLWRISRHRSLNGEGGRLFPGRWNSAGVPVVYLADSTGSALIEVLVHLQVEDQQTPPAYTLLKVFVPDVVSITDLKVPVGDAWKSDPSLTRAAGDRWLKSGRTALARVPSAILPQTSNYLINPAHGDSAHIKIEATFEAFYDPRLFLVKR